MSIQFVSPVGVTFRVEAPFPASAGLFADNSARTSISSAGHEGKTEYAMIRGTVQERDFEIFEGVPAPFVEGVLAGEDDPAPLTETVTRIDTYSAVASPQQDALFPYNVDGLLLSGTAKKDVLIGSELNDEIKGGRGNDTLRGGAGDDFLYGGRQNDKLIGGRGDDIVWSGHGRDTVYLGAGNDLYFDAHQTGVNGQDVVHGGGGKDTIWARGGSDILYGEGGHDFLSGGGGVDMLDGGTGNDILNGGAGADTHTGGTGADVFVFVDGATAWGEVITDFDITEDTLRLQLDGVDAYTDLFMFQAENGFRIAFIDSATGDRLYNGSITLEGSFTYADVVSAGCIEII